MHDVRSVLPLQATLGEGPVWWEDALWCVDIKQHHIHRFDPASGDHETWSAPAQVGWILPYAEGGFVVGLQTGIARFDAVTGDFAPLATIEPDRPGNRLNDACVAPDGRLWFGSMDDGERAKSGAIYRADARGIARVADGICITNGPAVSPDGATLYHHDTGGGLIFASRIADDGTLHDTRVFATIEPEHGYPDGPCVDAEGHVWVGLYAGWSVRRYSPAGALVETVRMPVANITKIAFGGPDLRTAYATTASKGMSAQERAAQPLAGDLFAFNPGVAGLPCPLAAAFAPMRIDG